MLKHTNILLASNVYYNLIKRSLSKLNIEPIENYISDNVETKLLKVAIIGAPNAGKSTFINSLVESQVCPTSKKVHTTRKSVQAILTEQNTQIVFLDTPGLVTLNEMKKYNLENSFLRDRKKCLKQADLVGIIHDAHNPYTRDQLDTKLINVLEDNKHIPSFLVLNKIDLLKSKRKLLDLIRNLTDNVLNGASNSYSTRKTRKWRKSALNDVSDSESDKNEGKWRHFSEIFMVSSLQQDGVDAVKNYLLEQSKPSPWLFKNYERTDQEPENLIIDTVKATLLDFLPQEIPYRLSTIMEYFERKDNGHIQTVVLVKCPSARIEKLIVGVSEGKLKQINAVAQRLLIEAFHCRVSLKVVTTLK